MLSPPRRILFSVSVAAMIILGSAEGVTPNMPLEHQPVFESTKTFMQSGGTAVPDFQLREVNLPMPFRYFIGLTVLSAAVLIGTLLYRQLHPNSHQQADEHIARSQIASYMYTRRDVVIRMSTITALLFTFGHPIMVTATAETYNGCTCMDTWGVAEETCSNHQSVQYSGCGMSPPCDGDSLSEIWSSWCFTTSKDCAGQDWDYCSPTGSTGGSATQACRTYDSIVSCNAMRLLTVPEIYNRDVEEVFLDGNIIETIPNGWLDGATKLERLYMSFNLISAIPINWLKDAVKLQYLRLSQNAITSIPDGWLDNAVSLLQIYMGGNPITEIPARWLDNAIKLTHCTLAGNLITAIPPNWLRKIKQLNLFENAITAIPENWLKGIEELLKVRLYENKITSIPDAWLDNANQLSILEMQKNEISKVPTGWLSGLPNLSLILLQKNDITMLPPGALTNLPKLTTLNLEGNKLSAIPDGLFANMPKLRKLLLHDNLITEAGPEALRGLPAIQLLTLHGNRIGTLAADAFGSAIVNFPVLMPNAAFCAVTEPEYAEDPASVSCKDATYHTGYYFKDGSMAGCSALAESRCGQGDVRNMCPKSCSICPAPDDPPLPALVRPVFELDTFQTLSCTHCSLGYVQDLQQGCVLPAFGASSNWTESIAEAFGTDFGGPGQFAPAELFLGKAYSSGAPALTPKDTMFVGYANGLFADIRYELEFGVGVADIGCGEVVSGDTSDPMLTPGLITAGSGNGAVISNPEPKYGPDYLYDSIEHRYRLRVRSMSDGMATEAKVTFDTCLSWFPTALTVYSANGTQVYPTIERSIKPGEGAKVFSALLPHERGCGVLSLAAKATVTLPAGDYVVAVEAGLSWDYRVSSFFEALERNGRYTLRITCDALKNAEVLRGSDEQPGGISVDPLTGAVSGAPEHAGHYAMNLTAVDSAGQRAVLRQWEYVVKPKPDFSVTKAWETLKALPCPGVQSEYSYGKSYSIPAPELSKETLFANPDGNHYTGISYKLSFSPIDRSPSNLLVDPATGRMLFSVVADDKLADGELYHLTLVAADTGGATAVVKQWSFAVVDPPAAPRFQLGVKTSRVILTSVSGVIDPNATDRYTVGRAYRIAPLRLDPAATTVSSGTFDDITYTLSTAAPGSWFVQASTGVIFGDFETPGQYEFAVLAVDKAGQSAVLEVLKFNVVDQQEFRVVVKTERAKVPTPTAQALVRSIKH